IRLRADEGARRLAVAEVDKIHGDDLIDNSRQLAAGFAAVHLHLEFGTAKIVDCALQDCDKDHVARARMLKLIKPIDQLAGMKPVSAAHVLLARALGKGFRLLLCPAEGEPAYRRKAVDKKRAVVIDVRKRPIEGRGSYEGLVMALAVAAGRRERAIGPA